MRQLLSVAGGPRSGAYGAVIVDDDGTRSMDDGAARVLRGVVAQHGLDAVVDDVMANGWANQKLYFGEVINDAG
jgi:hypothetical protein